MSQPLDRTVALPALGEIDEEAGEFWVENPFNMQSQGMNLSAYERNKMYLNRRGTGFVDASFAAVADIDSDSRSAVAADFDRDGGVDLLVASDGGGPLRLFLNRFPERGRSVQVELIGSKSNRSGIGSRVIAHCGNRKIVRDVFAPNGFLGQGPAEISIGVGQAEKIDRLTVRWPTGETQEFADVASDCRIRITEGNMDLVIAEINQKSQD